MRWSSWCFCSICRAHLRLRDSDRCFASSRKDRPGIVSTSTLYRHRLTTWLRRRSRLTTWNAMVVVVPLYSCPYIDYLFFGELFPQLICPTVSMLNGFLCTHIQNGGIVQCEHIYFPS
uniref:Uncharacterized protein n=1 Tax=Cacopsylla melanoneura TaxID=428564 RepID=A0A8D8W9L4_9HEMI